MTERCMDCPRDATHTLRWHTTPEAWRASKLNGPRDGKEGRYCAWHATVHGTQLNAQRVKPGTGIGSTRGAVPQHRREGVGQ